MVGTIKVGKLQAAAGTSDTISIESGHKLSGAAGSIVTPGMIVQVVTAVDDGSQSTTSQTLVDTGLTLDITPKFQNSKMQIFANMYECYSPDASSSVQISLRRVVGGTDTEIGDHDAATLGYTRTQEYDNVALQHLDTPNTTSTITYKIQIKSSGGYVVYVNGDNTQTQLCVMEVAQ